jgi:threonine/homoserine/homoserine lactone efflux protein
VVMSMIPEHILAFLVFAVVAAVTPGPSNVVLAATGARVGVWRGLPCLFGVSLGMGTLMFLVAFGVGNLILESPRLMEGLRWVGIAFLFWLAWKIATLEAGGTAGRADVVGFWRAATLQAVNPKAWLVTASAAGAFLQSGTGASGAFAQSLAFAALFVLAALPSGLVWLAFGATVQRGLRTERAWRVFSLVMGALLAASVLLYVW